jgi:hypothetical protein
MERPTLPDPELDSASPDPSEIRQVNARLRSDVYQVLKFIGARRELSVGKLAEHVLTEFAATCLAEAQEEARAAVAMAERAAEALDQIRIEIGTTGSKETTKGNKSDHRQAS